MVLLDQIYELKDDTGAEFSYAFHALPLRANIEYYKVIKNPMSYSKIKMAAKHKRYTHPQAFINELSQIAWNAKFFNEESSEYYRYATILDNFIKEKIIPELINDDKIFKHNEISYPNLGALPNDSSIKITNITSNNTSNHITSKTTELSGVSSTVEPTERVQNNKIEPVTEIINSPAISHVSITQDTATPIPEDEEDDDYNETKHDEDYNTNENELRILNQTYNPNSYTSTIEDTGFSHAYIPPKPPMGNYPNPDRHVLDQWVKRGRPPIVDKPHEQRIKSIMRGLKKIKVGNKTIVSFWDKLPGQQEHPDYLKIVKDPITMLDIKSLIKQRYYKTVDSYISDVFKLIQNNRAYFVNDDFIKNNLNILEANISRLYQIEMSKPDVEYMSGQLTSRLPLSQVVFNGKTYKVGSWILVNNPNDPTRPTVAQIFRLWQMESGDLCMNVCWYYRPEWTVHRVDRLFLDNEVMKTGQYRDHLVNEIVGPCYVAYFTRWLKGDPGIPFEGPLFVCEFRYNDKENTFAKIRTWKACLPDEVRHLEDPIKPLTTNRILKKFPSPIKNLLAPGSTNNSPIPQPIILNLNSPPLVGAVYIPRAEEEVDTHYFDNSLTETQCKSYVPPTTNIRIPSSQFIDDNGDSREISSSGSINVSSINSTSTLTLKKNIIPPINPTYKAYSKPTMTMNLPHSYTGGSHKVIKTPYNLNTYTFSQFHSPSTSFTYIKFNGGEENLQNLVKQSYLSLDKRNLSRINKSIKTQQINMGSTYDNGNNVFNKGVEPNSLIWFRGPPLKIVDRILPDGDDIINNDNVGIKRIRCGHSAEYIAWKLKKQKK
ncbi:hypothetical protein C6P40_004707 [Pichia californica]|uniref:Chromatin structure-remodeling complex subunit RSC1 n=1 Tax=Pichia californica TaxID=460514 RepID=A0A9P7BGT8_9ASCO|nr:hypothetical protein C6P42_004712 [[Candida] californica]KAG0689630.1 hypothetical protein C6P40_004707 [[Candida] californica]